MKMATLSFNDAQQMRAWRKHLYYALRTDYLSFLRKSFHTLNPGQTYHANWHIEAIAEHLDALERCDIKRLIINMPPRSLKSLSTTVAWSAYMLGKMPHQRIITASYSAPISIKHATDTRSLVNADWYRNTFPEFQLFAGQNEKHKFMTTQQGFRLSTSVGGTLTGEGGDIIIIDDPLSPLQALSNNSRNEANNWFDHTLSSRLNDKVNGKMLLVMQRLHTDDLSGHLLEKGGWEHLCLPAQASSDITIDLGMFYHIMRQGQLLQPKRETAEVLHQLRMDLGSMSFSAQYLQVPVNASGSMIRRDWIVTADAMPHRDECERVIQSWDTAIKTGTQHDFSACVTIGVYEHRYYILDVVTLKADYPDLKRMIASHYDAFRADAVLIEDKASGQSLLQDLRSESAMPLLAMMPKGDKVTRVARITPLLEAGMVLFPRYASWKDDFISEALQFPQGSHDDQMDALSQGLQWLHNSAHQQSYIREL